jgi:uncharacterized protein (TIGR02284 family)
MKMEKDDLIKKLCKLSQLDIDAMGAYEKAIEHIEENDADIKIQLNSFKADHQKHIQDLGTHIRSLGGTPPKETPDFSGLLQKGYTALRSITGTEGALNAMETNEQSTNKAYAEALEETGLPEDVRILLAKNRADEARHLEYIQNTLETFKNKE